MSDAWKEGRCVVVTKEKHFNFVHKNLPHAELTEKIPSGSGSQLITFATGKIIPPDIILLWDRAINFHGASPNYPGRDPHHWAAYDGTNLFGATAHAIWPKVDAGPICCQMLVGVATPQPPDTYRKIGEAALYSLFTVWCSQYTSISFDANIMWSGKKRKRKDLLDACDMRNVTEIEKERRKFAFAGFEKFFIE